jgi:prepilin-type N-terminal cleavage/methylation domain-containing protein
MPDVIRKGRKRFEGQGGFTLFEVIMVLLILGVISYFAATRLFTDDGISRVSERDLVKNHLRYAQARAMNTEPATGYTKVWGIKFGSATRYWLYKEPNENAIIRLPGVETSDGAMVLSAIQLSWSSPATEKVSFDSFGSPGGDMLTYIVQPKGGGSSLGSITVTKNTGFIP